MLKPKPKLKPLNLLRLKSSRELRPNNSRKTSDWQKRDRISKSRRRRRLSRKPKRHLLKRPELFKSHKRRKKRKSSN